MLYVEFPHSFGIGVCVLFFRGILGRQKFLELLTKNFIAKTYSESILISFKILPFRFCTLVPELFLFLETLPAAIFCHVVQRLLQFSWIFSKVSDLSFSSNLIFGE